MAELEVYATALALAGAMLLASYLIGSIPFAYIIVRLVTGEDITEHGSGNVGSMNVRRTTGSWSWFTVAMVADAAKGLAPVLLAKAGAGGFSIAWLALPVGEVAGPLASYLESGTALLFLPTQAAVLGSVLGHNYSVWIALLKRRFSRTGKGLATGGGALLAYDWRYFVVALVVGLAMIALTRYMMAGQVAAAAALPVTALLLHSVDWPFALLMGALVYAAHHRRFIGMLQGREPRLYVNDQMGPRG
jgi:acyl phosphate:glycerol-3-phosphate acyltransferase